MNSRAAAVYPHGILAFNHKRENNTIKLPRWAIRYSEPRRGPYISLSRPFRASLAAQKEQSG